MKVFAGHFCRVPTAAVLLAACRLCQPQVQANPAGGTVAQGTATFSTSGSQLTIQTSDRAYINWQSFNIDAGETTTFQQPSSSSLVWNNIHDSNPSQILGNLNANGYVVLQNQAGFFIGGQAAISTRGLILTTAPIPMPDLSSGGAWSFNTPPPTASIINYGQITAAKGGSVFLIAADVENQNDGVNTGTIAAPAGRIGLYAGKQVLVSERPDGRGLSARVKLPQGSVDNEGNLIADAGTIAMHAQVVNQGGLVQANSVKNVNGVIELVAGGAGGSLVLGAKSDIEAHGDNSPGNTGASPGGFVILKSDNAFGDTATSVIHVEGGTGTAGGRDGMVEVFGAGVGADTIQSLIDGGSAAQFSSGNHLLVSPNDLTLSSAATTAPVSDPTTANPNNPNLNLGELSAYSQIDLQAGNNITLGSSWSLPAALTDLRLTAGGSLTFNANCILSLSAAGAASQLSLYAGKDISLKSSSSGGAGINGGTGWSVNMAAGTGIYLYGTSTIQTSDGDINLWAANEVQVGWSGTAVSRGNPNRGTGSIITTGGGSISVTAESGSVNTGSGTGGFSYTGNKTAPYYNATATTLGGISTAAGGDVTISAGGDVTSYMPAGNGSLISDAGTGAFGPLPGDVTISAVGSVYGHYVVVDGQGTITAGANIGSTAAKVALSLVNGGWSLDAPNGNIYLQEVRNPNGLFDNSTKAGATGRKLFDYSPEASLDLNAGIGVYLTGDSLPRLTDYDEAVLYPPILNISSGSGGVVLQNSVILFPSPYQDLQITTTAGGSLVANNSTASVGLIMSDSAQRQIVNGSGANFGSSSENSFSQGAFGTIDHAPVPPELKNPDPVRINISGNIENLQLYTSKQTRIKVGGDMKSDVFRGENLRPGDVTSIDVAGQIFDRSPYTFEPLLPGTTLPKLPSDALPANYVQSWQSFFQLGVNPDIVAGITIPAGLSSSQVTAYISKTYGNISEFAAAPFFGFNNPGFLYNPKTKQLGFDGDLSTAQTAGGKLITSVLGQPGQTLTVLKYGPDGNPVVVYTKDSKGHVTGHLETETVGWVDSTVINALSAASQGAPSTQTPNLGYVIGGPGLFKVHAGSIALGNANGIISYGVGTGDFANLASVTKSGASIDVRVDGDLEMVSSAIATLGGGNVSVTSGGAMDLGSPVLIGSKGDFIPAIGIYSTGKGNVSVTAADDINVDGSRIATYNGGNLSVESLQGNVDAGNGGAVQAYLHYFYVDPKTGAVVDKPEQVYGSGILAVAYHDSGSFPGGAARPGDIIVETPRGNITASQGGILQEAQNGINLPGPTITLSAGSPGYIGNIDLGSSGVIGGAVDVAANGNISGLVISRQNSTITAGESFNGTVLSGGLASLSAGGTVSGIIIGVGGATVTGGAGISATVLSQNANVGGQSQNTLGASATATGTSQAAAQQSSSDSKQVASNDSQDDDDQKKKGRRPALTRRAGRVTVILPPKS